jgi:MATE family multidrug resistance protein
MISPLPNQYDFLGRFFRLALTNVLSSIMVPLASTVSVIFLGHLDKIHHLAGVALSGTLLSCLYEILAILRFSTTGVTAQAVGRDDREGALLVGLRNGSIALIVGTVLLLLQYPLQRLGFALMDSAPDVKAAGIACFNAQIWGAPAILLNFVLLGWFLGQERNSKVLLLSVLSNVANIALDYLFIVRWDWASTGAGVSQAISPYITLLLGLLLLLQEVNLKEIQDCIVKVWDTAAFKNTLSLNKDLFISRSLVLSCLLIFNYQSAALGTIIYAQNALFWQVIILGNFCFDGIACALETLVGNFTGKGTNDNLLPLIGVGVGTSLLTGLTFASLCAMFPLTVFGLFTNHVEVLNHIDRYTPWLLLVIGSYAVDLILYGYFSGLAAGQTIRNSTLIAVFLGFVPTVIATYSFHSNHVLWLSWAFLPLLEALAFAVQLPKTLTMDTEHNPLPQELLTP